MRSRVISISLITVCIICGIFMLFFGIRNAKISGSYKEIEGYFVDYTIYSNANSKHKTTYCLTYTYSVNGEEYFISTDTGTEIVPEKNATRVIKYNPNNPEDAFISGGDKSSFLIVMGIMFVFVPLIILFGMLYTMGYFENILEKVIDFSIGLIFIVLGYGVIFLITGKLSIIALIKVFKIPFVIPILFIIVGVYQLINCLFFKYRKKARKNDV